jgi:ribosomal protein S18 acetylase RimI-like enzyme
LLGPDDWQTFRDLRLAALKEAPHAFGSKFEVEAGASEEQWRHRITGWTRFAAEIDGQVVGLVGAGSGEFTGAAALTSLWVDPRFRGLGVGSALIDAVEAWALGQGLSQILLWVTETNQAAERLYERRGFTRTGAAQSVRPDEPRVEFEMSKRI